MSESFFWIVVLLSASVESQQVIEETSIPPITNIETSTEEVKETIQPELIISSTEPYYEVTTLNILPETVNNLLQTTEASYDVSTPTTEVLIKSTDKDDPSAPEEVKDSSYDKSNPRSSSKGDITLSKEQTLGRNVEEISADLSGGNDQSREEDSGKEASVEGMSRQGIPTIHPYQSRTIKTLYPNPQVNRGVPDNLSTRNMYGMLFPRRLTTLPVRRYTIYRTQKLPTPPSAPPYNEITPEDQLHTSKEPQRSPPGYYNNQYDPTNQSNEDYHDISSNNYKYSNPQAIGNQPVLPMRTNTLRNFVPAPNMQPYPRTPSDNGFPGNYYNVKLYDYPKYFQNMLYRPRVI